MNKQEEIKTCSICDKDKCKCPVIDRGSFAKYVKRDEIREGIDRVLFQLEEGDISVFEAKVKLGKLGVVLKVDKPLPKYDLTEGISSGLSPFEYAQQTMLKAGYVATESLIEDDNA